MPTAGIVHAVCRGITGAEAKWAKAVEALRIAATPLVLMLLV